MLCQVLYSVGCISVFMLVFRLIWCMLFFFIIWVVWVSSMFDLVIRQWFGLIVRWNVGCSVFILVRFLVQVFRLKGLFLLLYGIGRLLLILMVCMLLMWWVKLVSLLYIRCQCCVVFMLLFRCVCSFIMWLFSLVVVCRNLLMWVIGRLNLDFLLLVWILVWWFLFWFRLICSYSLWLWNRFGQCCSVFMLLMVMVMFSVNVVLYLLCGQKLGVNSMCLGDSFGRCWNICFSLLCDMYFRLKFFVFSSCRMVGWLLVLIVQQCWLIGLIVVSVWVWVCIVGRWQMQCGVLVLVSCSRCVCWLCYYGVLCGCMVLVILCQCGLNILVFFIGIVLLLISLVCRIGSRLLVLVLLMMKVRFRLLDDCEIMCMCLWLKVVYMFDSLCSSDCMLWFIRVIVVYGMIIFILQICDRLVDSVVSILVLIRFLDGFSDIVMLVLVELIRFIDRLCFLNRLNILVRKLICCYILMFFIDISMMLLWWLIVFIFGIGVVLLLMLVFGSFGCLVLRMVIGMLVLWYGLIECG